MDSRAVESLVEWLMEARRAVFLTGTELSAESGVVDFASPAFNPPIGEFRSSRRVRSAYWKRLRDLYPVLAEAEPNAAHVAVAELEALGMLDSLFTLAADGLHYRAGSSVVMELNSTVLWIVCTRCGKGYELEAALALLDRGSDVPECDSCGSDLLKPEISFPGQPPPHWELREAWMRLRGCDLFVLAGADVSREPASSLPWIAKEQGARVAVISQQPGPFDEFADAVVYAKPSDVLSHVVEMVKERMPVS